MRLKIIISLFLIVVPGHLLSFQKSSKLLGKFRPMQLNGARFLRTSKFIPQDNSLASLMRAREDELEIFEDTIIGNKYNVKETFPPRYSEQVNGKHVPNEEVYEYVKKKRYEVLKSKSPEILALHPQASLHEAYEFIETHEEQISKMIEHLEHSDAFKGAVSNFLGFCFRVKSHAEEGTLAKELKIDSRDSSSLVYHWEQADVNICHWALRGCFAQNPKSELLDQLIAFEHALALLNSKIHQTIIAAHEVNRKKYD